MPIFEYLCKKCDRRFEALVHSTTAVECPGCKSNKLEKQLSVFATSGGNEASRGKAMPAGSCGTCGDPRGPGSCSMN